MATKRDLIDEAYELMGLGSYEFDLSPEQINLALRRLNQLCGEWDSIGVRIAFNSSGDLNDDSGISIESQYAVTSELSIRLMPTFGKMPSPALSISAKRAYLALLNASSQIDEYTYPSTMPFGRGNRRSTRDNQYFTETDPLQSGPDGELNF